MFALTKIIPTWWMWLWGAFWIAVLAYLIWDDWRAKEPKQ